MELRRSKELSKGGLGTKLKRSGRKLETREGVKAAWTGATENMEEIREVLKDQAGVAGSVNIFTTYTALLLSS